MRAVLQAPSSDTAAHALIVHDQVEREVFDEELHVVLQALLVQRVQDRMPRTVGGGAGAARRLLAVVRHVAAERALVDLARLGAAERHAEMLQLVHRLHRLAAHVFDRVLVTQPVRPLHGVVHVPAPVVLTHVAERSRDAALCRHGVAARREHLADAGRLQTGRTHAEGCAQSGAARANHHDVIGMIDDVVRPRRGQGDRVHRYPFAYRPSRSVETMQASASNSAMALITRIEPTRSQSRCT